MAEGLRNIEAWIYTDVCGWCIYSFLTYCHPFSPVSRRDYAFYSGDTFSKFVEIPDANMGTRTYDCPSKSGVPPSGVQDVLLRDKTALNIVRTIGEHGYMLTPHAQGLRRFSFKVGQKVVLTVKVPFRRMISLLTIMDLNARVLRAERYKNGGNVFCNWMREKRINLEVRPNDMLDLLLPDIYSLYRENLELKAATEMLSILPFTGKISKFVWSELHSYLRRNVQASVHDFIAEKILLIAPPGALSQCAQWLWKRFEDTPCDHRTLDYHFDSDEAYATYEVESHEDGSAMYSRFIAQVSAIAPSTA